MSRLSHSSSSPSLPDSWSGALQAYERERRGADGFSIASPIRFDKQKMASHYEYNPLTGTFNDANKEREAVAAEQRSRMRRFNTNANAGYNILANYAQEEPSASPAHAAKRFLAAPHLRAREYNLISLNPASPAAAARISADDEEEKNRRLKIKEFHKARGAVDKQAMERRDYSIISGNYYENHTKRSNQESAEDRAERLKILYGERNFHPLRQQFYNPQEEEKAREEENRKWKIQNEKQFMKMPATIRQSAQRGYNIVNPQVEEPPKKPLQVRPATVHAPFGTDLDVPGKLRVETLSPGGRARFNPLSPTTHEFETQKRQHHIDTVDRELRRLQNRISAERYKHEKERGYNLINNQPNPL